MAGIALIIEAEKRQRLLRLTNNVSNGINNLHNVCRSVQANVINFTPTEIGQLLGLSYEDELRQLDDHRDALLEEAKTVSILRNHLAEGERDLNIYTNRLNRMIRFTNPAPSTSPNALRRNITENLNFIVSEKDTVMTHLENLEAVVMNAIIT